MANISNLRILIFWNYKIDYIEITKYSKILFSTDHLIGNYLAERLFNQKYFFGVSVIYFEQHINSNDVENLCIYLFIFHSKYVKYVGT